MNKIVLKTCEIKNLLPWFETINLGKSIVYIIYVHQGVTGYYFQIILYFFSVKILYVLANSVDPDEMLHSVAFHQFLLFVKVRI